MSDMFNSLMEGLNEALDDAKEKKLKRTKISILPIREYSSEEIKQIRVGCNMTQSVFAECLGVTKKAVEAWECGRNKPNGPALRLIYMLQADKEIPYKYKIILIE